MTAQTFSERAGARNISAVGAVDLSEAWRLAVIALALVLGLAWAVLASQRSVRAPAAPATPAPMTSPPLPATADAPAPTRASVRPRNRPVVPLQQPENLPVEEADPFAGVEVLNASELAAISQAR